MWAANLLSTDSHTQNWQVLQRMLSQKSCISMAHLATSSYPGSIPPWTSHTEPELTALFTESPTTTVSFPLSLGVSSLLQEPPQHRRMQWPCLQGGSCPKAQVHPQQQRRGAAPVVSLQVSPLSLSTKFVQLRYFKNKPVLSVLRAPWITHMNTLKTCSIMWSAFSAKTGEAFT